MTRKVYQLQDYFGIWPLIHSANDTHLQCKIYPGAGPTTDILEHLYTALDAMCKRYATICIVLEIYAVLAALFGRVFFL